MLWQNFYLPIYFVFFVNNLVSFLLLLLQTILSVAVYLNINIISFYIILWSQHTFFPFWTDTHQTTTQHAHHKHFHFVPSGIWHKFASSLLSDLGHSGGEMHLTDLREISFGMHKSTAGAEGHAMSDSITPALWIRFVTAQMWQSNLCVHSTTSLQV